MQIKININAYKEKFIIKQQRKKSLVFNNSFTILFPYVLLAVSFCQLSNEELHSNCTTNSCII